MFSSEIRIDPISIGYRHVRNPIVWLIKAPQHHGDRCVFSDILRCLGSVAVGLRRRHFAGPPLSNPDWGYHPHTGFGNPSAHRCRYPPVLISESMRCKLCKQKRKFSCYDDTNSAHSESYNAENFVSNIHQPI